MEVKLIVATGKNAGMQVPISTAEFVIGRDEDCQLRARSEEVSRRHCVIVVGPGSVTVRDLGSKNGTFVNQRPVKGEQELKNGDRLRVGQLEFDLQLTVGVGGKKKAKVSSIQEAAARTVEAAADEELDVSDWLTQKETAVYEAKSDTRGPGSTPETATEPPAGVAERFRPGMGKPPRIAPLFDLAEAEQKTVGANSRQAAADVLKQLFQKDKDRK